MKDFGLSKANWKSFLLHSGIAILWGVVASLPAIEEAMVADLGADPAIAGAIVVILGVLLKKLTDKK